MSQRVFSKWDNESYPYRFKVELEIPILLGGIPSDPKVAEGWLKSKVSAPDDRIREMVAQIMVDREVARDEALSIVNDLKNLNGFRRTSAGVLFIEGRQLKAAIKEAVSIAVGAKKLTMRGWGETRKFITNFLPEHVFVLQETVELKQRDPNTSELVGVKAVSEILQQFVHTYHGSSIQYQEAVRDTVIEIDLISDYPFTSRDWGMIWTTGERNGLGASRSQGYGTYSVTKWDPQELPTPKPPRKSAAAAAKDITELVTEGLAPRENDE